MNLFNRLVVVLLDLALIAASVLTAVATFPAGNRWLARELPGLARLLELVPTYAPERYSVLVGAVAVALVGLLVLALELRSQRHEERLQLSADRTGSVEILIDSIRRLADHVAQRVPSVRESSSLILPTPKGLRVRCRVAVDPTANVPELAQEVRAKIGEAIEQHLGSHVAGISVLTQITPIEPPPRRRLR